MGEPRVLVEHSDEVALVTLNRPEALNALDTRVLGELESAFRSLDARAVVLTGAGRAFCTGADLKERSGMDETAWREHHTVLEHTFAAVRGQPAPTIAAVEGYALAGGLELALSCDLVVAAADAQLGLPEVTRGIIPGAGGTQLLSRLVGMGRAKELILTGRRIDAETAERYGLVARVSEPWRASDVALDLAREIARNAPLALRAAKRAIADGVGRPLAEGLRVELDAYWTTVPTADREEGVRAFVEGREPRFEGR
jgi:enoyl-CoA hydratase/carnithine racemase